MDKNLETKMNSFLASLWVLHTKTYSYHWYVEGQGFFSMHAAFEAQYNQFILNIDDVAERIMILGGKPIATMKKALATSIITEREEEAISPVKSLADFMSDLEKINNLAKETAKCARDLSDEYTADYFSALVGSFEKQLWLFRSEAKR